MSGNAHQRAVQKGRIAAYVAELMSEYVVPLPKEVSWYESGLFGGCFGLGCTIVLGVIVAKFKDLRWLLYLAWLPFVGCFWIACHRLRSKVICWFSFILLSLGAAIGLYLLPRVFPGLDLPHPIVEVGSTSVSYRPDTRTVTVTVWFMNTSTFDAQTRLTLWLMWDGKPLPDSSCTPKTTWNEKEIAMAPQPYNFWLKSSCTLSPEAASQWVNEKALISAAASATYADRDAATEYDFVGSVRRKQNFVDVVTTHRFTRPRQSAPY